MTCRSALELLGLSEAMPGVGTFRSFTAEEAELVATRAREEALGMAAEMLAAYYATISGNSHDAVITRLVMTEIEKRIRALPTSPPKDVTPPQPAAKVEQPTPSTHHCQRGGCLLCQDD